MCFMSELQKLEAVSLVAVNYAVMLFTNLEQTEDDAEMHFDATSDLQVNAF